MAQVPRIAKSEDMWIVGSISAPAGGSFIGAGETSSSKKIAWTMNIPQKYFLNIPQIYFSNIQQKYLLNIPQKYFSNIQQKYLLNIPQKYF